MALHHVHPASTHFDNALKMSHVATNPHSRSNLYKPPLMDQHAWEISRYEPPSITTKWSYQYEQPSIFLTLDSQYHRP